MAITKNTIVVEDRLRDLFAYLPPFLVDSVNYNPIFRYGDEIELNAFFKSKGNEDKPYPLIWLVYPYTEEHRINKVVIPKLELVLAVNTNSVMLNDERIEVSYRPILIPLLNNIRELFQKGNIIDTTDTYTVVKFPNYSDNGKNVVVDRWDALKVSIGVTITDNTLKAISMNDNTIVPIVTMPSLLTSNLTDLIGTAKV